jgi:hypothetical protein
MSEQVTTSVIDFKTLVESMLTEKDEYERRHPVVYEFAGGSKFREKENPYA